MARVTVPAGGGRQREQLCGSEWREGGGAGRWERTLRDKLSTHHFSFSIAPPSLSSHHGLPPRPGSHGRRRGSTARGECLFVCVCVRVREQEKARTQLACFVCLTFFCSLPSTAPRRGGRRRHRRLRPPRRPGRRAAARSVPAGAAQGGRVHPPIVLQARESERQIKRRREGRWGRPGACVSPALSTKRQGACWGRGLMPWEFPRVCPQAAGGKAKRAAVCLNSRPAHFPLFSLSPSLRSSYWTTRSGAWPSGTSCTRGWNGLGWARGGR